MNEALPCAAIADACLRTGAPLRWVDGLLPISSPAMLAGPALPVRHYGSVDVFFDAMLEARPGDVLVIDNERRRDEGCIGDLTVLAAMDQKIAGAVIWGLHRDTAELRRLGFPVFSLGVCPVGPRRLDPRSAGDPVLLGSETVTRDDFIFADDDGVMLVHRRWLNRVAEAAAEIVRSEREQARLARSGVSLHEQFQWDE